MRDIGNGSFNLRYERCGTAPSGREGVIVRHGSQAGVSSLGDRKVRVQKPRLRERGEDGGHEVEIPACEAMRRDASLGAHILKAMLKGVSTRNYEEMLPVACERMGVSKSSVSREFSEISDAECKWLLERRFDDLEILVTYIDGMVFGDRNVVGAVGVGRSGVKHARV